MANVSLTITVSTEPGEQLDLAEILRDLVGAKLKAAVASTKPAPASQAELQPTEPADKPVSVPPLRIQCPADPHPKHPSQVVVNGEMRTVPARVASVLAAIARGEVVARYRPETAEAIQQLVPEIVPGLSRDWTRKVIGKHASYAVSEWLREAFKPGVSDA